MGKTEMSIPFTCGRSLALSYWCECKPAGRLLGCNSAQSQHKCHIHALSKAQTRTACTHQAAARLRHAKFGFGNPLRFQDSTLLRYLGQLPRSVTVVSASLFLRGFNACGRRWPGAHQHSFAGHFFCVIPSSAHGARRYHSEEMTRKAVPTRSKPPSPTWASRVF